jgi:hypothetical protein
MHIRFWILVLCGILISAPAFAGVTVKQLDEYWANQRAYHQKKIDPNPDAWMAQTRPSADDAWVTPDPNATTGTALVNSSGDSSSESEDFMNYQKDDTTERDNGRPDDAPKE